MKVMCIESKWNPSDDLKNTSIPSYGEICEVVNTKQSRGLTYYALAGYSPEAYFLEKSFVPISDIDETEFVRDFITEKV
jgi:hypothetical protein